MSLNLEYLGLYNPTAVYHNLPVSQLVEHALARKEGVLSNTGALLVTTGMYTGRSTEDRFIVDDASIHDEISWGKVNVPIAPAKFDAIYTKMCAYLQNRELYVFDGFAGADPTYRIGVRVVNELASQNMFMHQLLLRPTEEELQNHKADFTVICAPGFKCVPAIDGVRSEAAIILSLEKRMVIVAGSQYSGEMKKSVFSMMNYMLPHKDVFPMHCSANIGKDGDSALFFGLSGTGKTTLSADPNRYLIGDDEHAWSEKGIFNMEGGCYAKCIKLSKEHEPEIYGAIRFGALVENVVFDPETRELDFDDDSLTENTRAGYPVDFISNAVIPGVGDQPKTVIFLTADAFGVLPPVAKLSREGAMFHFVTGYTARLAGTERGITEPQATFSTCFGAPFLPLPATRYAQLLGKYIDLTGANVYLVNTGWSGGPASGAGKRMKLPLTRAMITACLNGEIEKSEFVLDPNFNVMVPTTCPGVPSEVLSPRSTWQDKAAYDKSAKDLAAQFRKNFEKYPNMPKEVVDAAPQG